jgi:NTE family protein
MTSARHAAMHAVILGAVNRSRAVRPRREVLCILSAVAWLAVSSIAHAQGLAETTSSGRDTAASDYAARPRIGLVLSGGGARGAAHIGVLKVLEEMRVPIDMIAGTSMGAVVGGLYASGLTAREIEAIVTSLNWQDAFRDIPPREDLTFRRKQEDQNFLVKFPLGLKARRFLLPKGLIQGQKLNQALRLLTVPVAHITDFDDLPVPFRAVATDLETGEGVIIGDGDLTTAIRASLSAPGVFTPVEREGRLLVDGGLAENLPIDVARKMGADVLIVVDVGFPLLPRERLTNVGIISNQMLAILINRDSQRQKATLTDRDVLISPPLNDVSSLDFSIVASNIEAGEEAARAMAARLAAFSVPEQEYQRFATRRDEARQPPPQIDFVHIELGSQRYESALRSLFSDVVGKPLDPVALSESVTGYYGRGNLETLDYQIVKDDSGRYGIALTARRNSWGPNYVRFGLNLQDDFEGNSSYNAAARFLLSEITEPGGEWVWDLQVGETSFIATEIYLPLAQLSPYFFSPHAWLGARNVAVLDQQHRIAEYRVSGFEYGLDFGREFGNWGEIRAGVRRETGSSRVRIGDPTLPTGDFDARGFFLRLSYDRLDDINFPRSGQLASFQWSREKIDLNDNDSVHQLTFDWLGAKSFGRHTAVLWTSAGTTIDGVPNDVRTLFPLGGLFNLSGLRADSLTGAHYGIARVLLYRQIGRAGPGFLDVPAYLGVSFEAGNTWERRSDASFGSARKDGSIFLGLDTLLGPVYLAAGFEEGGQEAFYLFLGRTF